MRTRTEYGYHDWNECRVENSDHNMTNGMVVCRWRRMGDRETYMIEWRHSTSYGEDWFQGESDLHLNTSALNALLNNVDDAVRRSPRNASPMVVRGYISRYLETMR
jgi:hypothetical protein